MRIICLLILAMSCLWAAEGVPNLFTEGGEPAADGVRLKDMVSIDGVRDNQLHGIGIVVGLEGTGDDNAATLRLLRSVLMNNRLTLNERALTSDNVAIVAVTADLPAFARSGTRLHTQVASIGDAESLRGGVLLQTPMVAADGKIYAVAQGPVSVGGYGDAGPDLGVTTGRGHKNIETVATMVEGAIVEREVPATLLYGNRLRLVLDEPDFTTAHLVAEALAREFDPERVGATDAATVTLSFVTEPTDDELVATIARLESLRVMPDLPARVVINERTGTVVVGQAVRVSPAAVSHAGLSIKVMPQKRVKLDPRDPNKREEHTVYVNQVTGAVDDRPPPGVAPTAVPGTVSLMSGTTVEELANALNALGARPRDLVAIFQALHRAGALHADLVVM
ncbi:MAG: flagellar basal body P-ring protein FlgI [Planctomycetota bacterium]|jgi:flagellar P-ring protein precursor FlgI|nr:flagellar basal body P-ring protein FlgI [Planctomycetota bacterium]